MRPICWKRDCVHPGGQHGRNTVVESQSVWHSSSDRSSHTANGLHVGGSILFHRFAMPYRVLVELGVWRGQELVAREDRVGTGHEHERLLTGAEAQAA